MVDLLGPASSANSVTIRPTESRSFGANDTFFKDCSSQEIDDGTEFRASWFNQVLGALRSLARSNGVTALDATPIVTEDNADDNIIRKAVQHLIQRGQTNYAIAGGAANQITTSLSPSLVEYKGGVRISLLVSAENTGPTDINVGGLGWRDVKHPDGNELLPGTFRPNMIVTLAYDGTKFQYVDIPFRVAPVLSANRDYYVDIINGNDANDGLAAGVGRAFQHIQKAVDTVGGFNLNGFNVTIHVADGTYPESVSLTPFVGTGSVILLGNEAAPANVHVIPAHSPAIYWGTVTRVSGYSLRGLKLSAPVNGIRVGACIYGGSGDVSLRNIEFGVAADAHIFLQSNCNLTIAGLDNGDPSAFIRISGGALAHMRIGSGSYLQLYSPDIAITAAVSIGIFAQAYDLGVISGKYDVISGAGNVTGQKYVAQTNGVINTNGQGVGYFPGTIVGAVSSGGQYT